jgi:hypothetical protein
MTIIGTDYRVGGSDVCADLTKESYKQLLEQRAAERAATAQQDAQQEAIDSRARAAAAMGVAVDDLDSTTVD